MRIAFWTLTAAVSLNGFLVAADLTGSWKLDLRKSKLQNEEKGITATVELVGPNTLRIITDVLPKAGPSRHSEAVMSYDGKPHPAPDAPGAIDVYEHPDPLTWKTTQTRDGKVVAEIVQKLSKDGRTRTAYFKTIKPDGQTVEELRYYDRQ